MNLLHSLNFLFMMLNLIKSFYIFRGELFRHAGRERPSDKEEEEGR